MYQTQVERGETLEYPNRIDAVSVIGQIRQERRKDRLKAYQENPDFGFGRQAFGYHFLQGRTGKHMQGMPEGNGSKHCT